MFSSYQLGPMVVGFKRNPRRAQHPGGFPLVINQLHGTFGFSIGIYAYKDSIVNSQLREIEKNRCLRMKIHGDSFEPRAPTSCDALKAGMGMSGPLFPFTPTPHPFPVVVPLVLVLVLEFPSGSMAIEPREFPRHSSSPTSDGAGLQAWRSGIPGIAFAPSTACPPKPW